jgi:Ca-activated chloride channel family protein
MPWKRSVSIDAVELRGISTVWARRKIENTLDAKIDGVSADLIRKIVLDVALEHKVVSPYTSFVAVDEPPVRADSQALARQNIASMRPAGQTAAAMPQTASFAPLYRLLGALLVAAAGLLWLGRPRLAA